MPAWTFLKPIVEDFKFENVRARFEFYSASFGQKDDALQWIDYVDGGCGVAMGLALGFFALEQIWRHGAWTRHQPPLLSDDGRGYHGRERVRLRIDLHDPVAKNCGGWEGCPIGTLFAALHESGIGRFCCKSPKTPGDKFPARRRNRSRSPADVASGSLPKSLVSLSPSNEVPTSLHENRFYGPENFDHGCKKTFANKIGTKPLFRNVRFSGESWRVSGPS
jgi:hypothetical protein